MGKRGYPKPENLAAKLFAIRQSLGLSQTKLARHLNFPDHYNRISEFEKGRRVPSALMLLAYARAAGISTDVLIDDESEVHLTKG